jgi:HD superfamily phosphodiesterase
MPTGDFTKLEHLVEQLYESKDPNRDGWADWLYVNHVIWTANKAEGLAKRFNIDPQLSRAAALLHDISDAKIERQNSGSEELSLTLARDLLRQAHFDEATIVLLVDDALRYHSCRNGEKPSSDVGKVLATADALAHFQTDFYPFAFSSKLFGDYNKLKAWSAQKIAKDFNNKIFFDEVREEARPQFETLKLLFGAES